MASATEALSDAVLAITAEHAVEPVLQKLVDAARELTGARYAAIGVPDGVPAAPRNPVSRPPAPRGVCRTISVWRGSFVTPLTGRARMHGAGVRRTPAPRTIGQTFVLARAADAHAAIESRATLGKTLLVA
jgi:hypothetical protein